MKRLALALAFCVTLLQAQDAPKLLPFQGHLTDATGSPVPDGAKVVQFKLYNAPVGGQAVWNGEVHKLTVNAGLISTILGSKADLHSVDFNRALYLEITVDANNDGQITIADPPLLPRQSVLPSVFSVETANARKLNGHDWSAILASGNNPADGFIRGDKLNPRSLTASQISSGTITANEIAANTITAAQIAPNTITSAQIADATITSAKLTAEIRAALDALVPAGTIVAFGGHPEKIPPGWLLCDGREVSSATYSNLFSAISTNWGGAAPSNFRLPDLRGTFLRGVRGARTDRVDGDSDRRLPAASDGTGNRGNSVGSYEASYWPTNHLHRWAVSSSGTAFTRQLLSWNRSGSTVTVLADYGQRHIPNLNNDQDDNFKEVTPGQNERSLYTEGAITPQTSFFPAPPFPETRPQNVYVHYIIKY